MSEYYRRPVNGGVVTNLVQLAWDVFHEPGGEVGGLLHVVLDDGAFADHHIRACMEPSPGKREMTKAEKLCGEAWLAATIDERAEAYDEL